MWAICCFSVCRRMARIHVNRNGKENSNTNMGRINKANVKKTIYYLKRNGIRNTWYAVKERLEQGKRSPYSYVAPTEEELARQRVTNPGYQGIISIVVPTYNTPPKYLCEMIDSVVNQTYSNWELVLADATEGDSLLRIVASYGDKRIRYIRLRDNAGIANNTNGGLEHVSGEFVGLLDHDDVLTEDALFEVAVRIASGAKLIYSDEDKCNENITKYFDANFKEDFNLNLLLSNNYICHFMVMESELMKKLMLRPLYDGAQDYDLVLRATEALNEKDVIAHIPKVLYHWRCHTGSTAENPESKRYAYEAGRRALQDYADRHGWKAEAEHLKHLGFYRLNYETDVFENRTDLGAIGGKVIKRGKSIGGRITEEGEVLYEGLPAAYSGYLNRAVLTQDSYAVDVRCMRLRKECISNFEKITNVSYIENPKTGLFDAGCLPKETDYLALSLEVSRAIREAGYEIMYDPVLVVKW